MRKIMIRNTLLMLLATAVFAGALLLYLRSAGSVTAGESDLAGATSYTATASGYCSDVTVTASYLEDTLVALSIDAAGETPALGGAAAETLTATILEEGSTNGVDAIAQATMTSNAVLNAFADCEVQAGRLSEDEAAALTENNANDALASATAG